MHRAIVDRRRLLALGAGAGLALAGGLPRPGAAAQDASPAAAGAGGSLVVGKAQEAVGLDPALVTAASSFQVIAPVYDPLVRLDENLQPQPRLAESWQFENDTTVVFTLRPGVTFHNGRELVADDVKYSLERLKDPETASPWASQVEPIASVEVADPRTVRLTTSRPYGPLMSTLASDFAAIVPREEVEKTGDLQSTMVGTGPFRLAEYTRDTQTTLAANTAYWEPGLPRLAEVVLRILPEEATRLNALRTGEIGLTPLADPASVQLAGESEGIQVITQETTDYYLLGLNCARPPLDNALVRRALSLAIDRQAILDAVFFGEGSVAGPIVPTLGDWATPIAELPNYQPDPEQARALLAEAGHEGGFPLRIMASPLYPEFVNIALVLQEQLGAVGVEVGLDQVEWGTFIDRWRARDFEGFVSFNGSGDDPDRALFPAFRTGGSVNAFQFSDPEVDRLLDQARFTLDPAERQPLYRQAETLIADAAPALIIGTRVASFAHRDSVQGFAPTAVDTWDTLKETTVN